MPMNAGDRYAGHFDVTGPIGAGGMGEVYRARDTRLNRDVALKILPDAFAADPDRLARFQREAELLASLNHPSIAQIHGLEEDGGTRALVLELVDGPTLEERIARGPIPLDEALAIAAGIADALEAAHGAGVIHRDLKPANVKVRDDGAVKVLDFGLAKALESGPASGGPHDSPTMATAATQMGVIVGTAAYMSPEQARGRPVDRRADVWAFGAVVYEMLTGRKAFEGDDVTGILAEVIKSEPAWASLSADVPRAVSGVLRRCLAKDPGDRLRDIADVRLGLLGAFDDPDRPAAAPPPTAGPGRRRRAAELAVAAVLAAIVAGLGVRSLPAPEPPVPDPVRFTLPVTENAGPIAHASPRFLPDGRHFIYLRLSQEPDVNGLYVGTLDADPDAQDPTRLLATPRSVAYAPSPASAGAGHLLFMEDRRLLAQPFDDRRLQLAGSPTVVANDVGYLSFWGSFSVSRTGSVAWRGDEAAGSVQWLEPTGDEWTPGAIPDLYAPRNPRLSPDGRRLALVVAGDIWVFDLEGRPPIRLTFDDFTDASPLWTPDGARIVYEADGGLAWVSADGGGPPERLGPSGHFHAHAWSPAGDLIAVDVNASRLVEFAPREDAEPRPVAGGRDGEGFAAALSPDGEWLAYTSNATGQEEVWVRAYPGPAPPARLSPNGGIEPVWARDGRTLYYLEGRALMAVTVDTSAAFEFGAPVRLLEDGFRIYQQPPSYDVSADGRFVTLRSEAVPTISVLLNWPGLFREAGGD